MDPITIAAGISALGSLFKGVSGLFAGNAQAKAEKNAARQADAEAGVNAQIALAQGDQTAAQGAVQAAANGGGFVGSSLAAISDLSRAAMFKARSAVYRGQTEMQAHLYNAKVAKAQGTNDLIGGVIGAAGAAAGGMAGLSSQAKLMSLLRPAGLTAADGGAADLAGLF